VWDVRAVRDVGIGTVSVLLEVARGTRCVECDRGVRAPAVMWFCAIGELVWHPKCAQMVAVHLIGDTREALLAGDEDEQPFWRTRAIATVRHRLRSEEAVA
jgi:hypothetical protein